MRTLWDYAKEQEGQNDDALKAIASDEEKLDAERQELLNRVSSYSVNTLRDRVAWILNHYPETRNSDITLQLKYWETFESDVYNGYSIAPDDLYKLTKLTSLVRERARIQNQYKLFLANLEVRQQRGTLAEEEKEKAIADKPEFPVFVVYMDESGKTATHLLVGSVWFLIGHQTSILSIEIRKLKERRNFKGEFHFKEMKADDLPIYKELINIFLQYANAVSFKLISVPRVGIKSTQDALAELFYYLLVKGVDHEEKTGRAPLPRTLQVWKDAEEAGSDKLLLAKVEDRLKQAVQSIYKDKLIFEFFVAVDSKDNLFLQVADLLISSVNRILNRSGEKRTHKDEFAEFLLDSLGVDITLSPNEKVADMMVHLSL